MQESKRGWHIFQLFAKYNDLINVSTSGSFSENMAFMFSRVQNMKNI